MHLHINVYMCIGTYVYSYSFLSVYMFLFMYLICGFYVKCVYVFWFQRVLMFTCIPYTCFFHCLFLARTSGFVAFATSLKHRYLHCFMLPKAVLTDLRSTLRTCANLLVFAVFSQLPRQKMRSRPTPPHILQSMFLKTLRFVFKVLRNGLLRYILYTCPNLM